MGRATHRWDPPVPVALTAAAVREIEAPHLAAGVPLMARAARAVADAVLAGIDDVAPGPPPAVTADTGVGIASTPGDATRVLVLVGPGSNGGDGLFAAAHLADAGLPVTALVLSGRVHDGGLAAARAAGVRLLDGSDGPDGADLAALADDAVVIDAMVGTGAEGPLRGPAAAAVAALAGCRPRRVVAVDVPSGVGVDDGTLPGPVLAADLTVTMIAAKPALLLPPAAARAGRVQLADLGLRWDADPRVRATGRRDVAAALTPPREEDHKYSRGVLGVVAGSDRYPGAAVLTAGGALRTGVGMVRHLVPGTASDLVLTAHPEVVTEPGRVQALVLGPGADPSATDTLGAAVRTALAEGTPAVVDAGALDHLPGQVDGRPRPLLLTPHAGEAASLLTALRRARHDAAQADPPRRSADEAPAQVSRAQVEAAPAAAAEALARLTGAVVLLKGARTVVAGGGPLRVAAAGVPWLATAGSGDVLAGILGALLAGRVARAEADGRAPTAEETAELAAAGAVLHGLAARRAAGPAPGRPITPGDVVAHLPAVVADVLADAAEQQPRR